MSLTNFCLVSDGYAKLRERHSSEERCIDSDEQEASANRKENTQDATPASKQEVKEIKSGGKASSGESLFGAPGRLVKRALEHSSRYQQFADADSDDPLCTPLDKDSCSDTVMSSEAHMTSPDQFASEMIEPPVMHHMTRPPAADDTSEDQDTHPGMEKFKQKQDYGYQELDDEFGSKRSTSKPSTDYQNFGAEDVSSDPSRSHDDFESISQRTYEPPKQSILNKAVSAKPQDRIMGHEYGVKPLLDDDELSDSDLNPLAPQANPFTKDHSSSRGSSAMSSGSAAFITNSPALSPQSQNSEDSAINMADPFINVPFSKKFSSAKKRISKIKSPSQKLENEDIFGGAPFKRVGKAMSPAGNKMVTTYVNPVADQYVNPIADHPEDIFGNAPFHGSKHSSKAPTPSSVTMSPSVDMRSPSQSPEGVGVSLVPSSLSRENIPMSGDGGSSQLVPPAMSPGQIDLFGSGNFAEMTFDEAQAQAAQIAANKQQQRPASQPQYATFSQRPASQPQYATYSVSPSGIAGVVPPYTQHGMTTSYTIDGSTGQDLFGAQPFGEKMDLISPTDPPPSAGNIHKGPDATRLHGGGVRKPHKSSSATRHQRRRGSSGSLSSGSDGKPSPRSNKKDKFFSRSTELLHDENVEVLLGDSAGSSSLKKTKHKSSKKEKSRHKSGGDVNTSLSTSLSLPAGGATAFSNLSFCDDMDGEKDGHYDDIDDITDPMMSSQPGACSTPRSESHSRLNMDALRTSNAANYADVGEKSHKSQTLPRSTKKHRVLSNAAEAEPFTVEKKRGLFK